MAIAVLLVSLIVGCGRYGNPLPPEMFTPQAVKDLEAKASLTGIELSWMAPSNNMKGDTLESIDGYFVWRRKQVTQAGEVEDFEQVATLEDNHLQIQQQLQEEARAKGKIARRVKVKDELKLFNWLDKDVEAGTTYYYRVIPFNQGDTEGEINKEVRVKFRGDTSEIQLMNYEDELDINSRSF